MAGGGGTLREIHHPPINLFPYILLNISGFCPPPPPPIIHDAYFIYVLHGPFATKYYVFITRTPSILGEPPPLIFKQIKMFKFASSF